MAESTTKRARFAVMMPLHAELTHVKSEGKRVSHPTPAIKMLEFKGFSATIQLRRIFSSPSFDALVLGENPLSITSLASSREKVWYDDIT